MPLENPVKSVIFRFGTEEGRAACLTSGTAKSGTAQSAAGRHRLVPLLVEPAPSALFRKFGTHPG